MTWNKDELNFINKHQDLINDGSLEDLYDVLDVDSVLGYDSQWKILILVSHLKGIPLCYRLQSRSQPGKGHYGYNGQYVIVIHPKDFNKDILGLDPEKYLDPTDLDDPRMNTNLIAKETIYTFLFSTLKLEKYQAKILAEKFRYIDGSGKMW